MNRVLAVTAAVSIMLLAAGAALVVAGARWARMVWRYGP
jgi:hypothetical protein